MIAIAKAHLTKAHRTKALNATVDVLRMADGGHASAAAREAQLIGTVKTSSSPRRDIEICEAAIHRQSTAPSQNFLRFSTPGQCLAIAEFATIGRMC